MASEPTPNPLSRNFTSLVIWSLVFLFIVFSASYIWNDCSDNIACELVAHYHEVVSSALQNTMPKIIIAGFLFIIFKIFHKISIEIFLSKIVKKLSDPGRSASIIGLIGFFFWTLYWFITLTIFIGDAGKILTSFGLIGFGLTLALQKPIMNFVGWITIIWKGIYQVGDRIEIGRARGDVKEIRMMNTTLDGVLEQSQTTSNTFVSFPNEFVLTMELKNYTKDSNYIKEELSIGITYESNYRKAMAILESIITHQIHKNRASYLKNIQKKKSELNDFIHKLIESRSRTKQENLKLEQEAIRLNKDKHKLEEEEKKIVALEDEFIPKIRIELLDSSIQLIAQFMTPYDSVKKNRTVINLAFLEQVKKEDDIEIAYPHLEIIKKGEDRKEAAGKKQ